MLWIEAGRGMGFVCITIDMGGSSGVVYEYLYSEETRRGKRSGRVIGHLSLRLGAALA